MAVHGVAFLPFYAENFLVSERHDKIFSTPLVLTIFWQLAVVFRN